MTARPYLAPTIGSKSSACGGGAPTGYPPKVGDGSGTNLTAATSHPHRRSRPWEGSKEVKPEKRTYLPERNPPTRNSLTPQCIATPAPCQPPRMP
jgi:hypothetical protein